MILLAISVFMRYRVFTPKRKRQVPSELFGEGAVHFILLFRYKMKEIINGHRSNIVRRDKRRYCLH